MREKMTYQPPRMKEISFSTEKILDASPGFPELPDHDWVQSNQVQIFSDNP